MVKIFSFILSKASLNHLSNFSFQNLCSFSHSRQSQELASKVGGKAITLAELEHFHPEDDMILANATI